MKDLRSALQHQQDAGLYRRRRLLEGPQGATITLDGRRVINFCSNNYLGLANHPNVKAAFIKGIETYGAGGGAAHLINGHSRAHHKLEQELAEFTGYPRCLLYSTGYMANLGIAQALLERGDIVIEDRLNHASLLDAGLLSGARLQRYRHADVDHADSYLQQHTGREKLLMTDGVFSMDGDLAPLPALATSCRQHDAWLMVDDAHGIGVLGENGRGSVEYQGLNRDDVPILMGTLGKAFGTAGAFVAGSEDLIEYLIQRSRTYIYTTASPPAVAEATRASLKLVKNEVWRRQRLQQLVSQFREAATQIGLQLMDSSTPIQPVLIGDSHQASLISEQLLDRGFHVSAIRPPTVPEGTARLRITLCAEHSDEQLEQLLTALDEVMNQSAKL